MNKFWRTMMRLPSVKRAKIGEKTPIGYQYRITECWNWGKEWGEIGKCKDNHSHKTYTNLTKAKQDCKGWEHVVIRKEIVYDKGSSSSGKVAYKRMGLKKREYYK